MSDKAFFVDTTRCQGCRACQVACKQWNGLPGQKTEFFAGPEYTNPGRLSAITWNHVKFFNVRKRDTDRPEWTIMHKKCYHCIDANCIAVCPEKAISKVNGFTVIDQSKCIGCGACVSACVYDVPQVSDITHVNDAGQRIVIKDKSHKCNACTLNERDVPACVNTCPSGALKFGYRLEIIKMAQERLKAVKKEFPKASIYGLNEFGGLRVITILRDAPASFGLPVGKKAKTISVAKAQEVKDMYSLFATMSFGIPSLKRAAYRMAKSLSGNKKLS
jgi:formate dehydrogenase iron-sulfur subunit